ncbi:hypothetical protein [Aeromicrobium wangtongii]|uniref:hypothetical protein n=1 Tax=Aeromicrobium wangtongii TaxID=2969247 RepID=UPI002017839B|nr:hypothetical protein [Aeromicrobium wangtongii]MCL3817929.1 hypothetical protein [Aeromicrobium wangtongii]
MTTIDRTMSPNAGFPRDEVVELMNVYLHSSDVPATSALPLYAADPRRRRAASMAGSP